MMNNTDISRYDRHIRLSQIGLQGQQKLRDSSVLIVGVGGLGSPISLYLTAAGVGRIGLVDADCVSLSNLQRQVLYTEQQVGLPKVECARERLLALDSTLNVDIYNCRLERENAREIISSYDMVVDGCDNFATRYLIDSICCEQQKPYIYGSIGEFNGQVSVFNYKGGISYKDLFPENTDTDAVKGVMGVMPGVVGTLQAAEAVKIITGAGEVLSRKLLTVDLLSMETMILEL